MDLNLKLSSSCKRLFAYTDFKIQFEGFHRHAKDYLLIPILRFIGGYFRTPYFSCKFKQSSKNVDYFSFQNKIF